jgi:hypothetical protein
MAEIISPLNKEILELEARLQAKKQQLVESGIPAMPEKEVFKDVFSEHAQITPTTQAQSAPVSAKPQATSTQGTLLTPIQEQAIATLIQTAFDQGIATAIKQAKNDPFLIDALHDRLIDEYYQKLLDARKITND